ncbi:MAG: hypothetical protein K0B02_01600 [DPANN group archaeon]|nr:hypothetical protein [DPANN group archaeon]
MKSQYISIIMMMVLLLISTLSAQVYGAPVPVEELDLSISSGYDGSNTNIKTITTFEVLIDEDNSEISKYNIIVKNNNNYTIESKVNINFQVKPDFIEAYLAGNKIDIITKSDLYGNSRYTIKFDMLPFTNETIYILYTTLLVPNMWNIGLWGLQYNYNTPINMEFKTENYDYLKYQNLNFGNITFGYELYNVQCNNCIYKDNIAKITDENYFFLNWEKKRIPVKSGIVYIIMVFALGSFIIKKSLA